MPKLNVPLAVQVLNQVTLEPQTHAQDLWVSSCGTTRCIAGWALELSGTRIKRDKHGETVLYRGNRNWEAVSGSQIRAEAGAALGISPEVAEDMFLYEGDQKAVAHLARLVAKELKARASDG